MRGQVDNFQSQTARVAQAPVQPAPERLAFAGAANPEPELRAAPPVFKQHVVKRNETLASIARAHRVRLESILAANPTLQPKRLQPGQTIKIPAP